MKQKSVTKLTNQLNVIRDDIDLLEWFATEKVLAGLQADRDLNEIQAMLKKELHNITKKIDLMLERVSKLEHGKEDTCRENLNQ